LSHITGYKSRANTWLRKNKKTNLEVKRMLCNNLQLKPEKQKETIINN